MMAPPLSAEHAVMFHQRLEFSMRFSRSVFAVLALLAAACDPPVQQTTPDGSVSGTPTPAPSSSNTQASAPTSQPTNVPSSQPSASTSAAPAVDPPSKEAMQKLAKSTNKFGIDLFKKVSEKQKENLVVSPASVSTALTMTWGGAKNETAAQMKKVLAFEGEPPAIMETSGKLAAALTNPSRPVTFRIANQLFGEKTYTFDAGYLSSTEKAFGAPIERVDFIEGFEPARVHINGWVESKTEKRIKDLIPPRAIDKETRLVLVNAIYFLGDWSEPFEKDSTRPMPFTTGGSKKVDVPTMNRTGSFNIASKDGVTALELPYKGGDMSMMIIVPDAADGIAAAQKSLTADSLSALASAMKPERVWASIPKFEVNPSESVPLKDVLSALGMPIAFDRDKADFTGIANPPEKAERLVISQVFHKAFIKVDEKGTEAAAATSVNMARAGSAAPAKPREFKADRPFLFVIKDNASGLVLFMGRVMNPAAS